MTASIQLQPLIDIIHNAAERLDKRPSIVHPAARIILVHVPQAGEQQPWDDSKTFPMEPNCVKLP